MQKFKSVEDLVNRLQPVEPVYCIRKNTINLASKYFQKKFPGKILYALKTNPNLTVLKTIVDSGINNFDVASINEIQTIKKISPSANCSYMHTIKSRESIEEAYFKYNIKTFSLDTKDELIKILESTKKAKDLELFVRVAVSNEHAEIDLSKKFGATSIEASGLLRLTKPIC
jgi:Diaminopimelate decarboxylase